jgi:hypothetical protein
VRVTLDLELPEALESELQMAAKKSGIPAHAWAAQALEAELASRRLPQVAAAPHGARIGTREIADAEPDCYAVYCPEGTNP